MNKCQKTAVARMKNWRMPSPAWRLDREGRRHVMKQPHLFHVSKDVTEEMVMIPGLQLSALYADSLTSLCFSFLFERMGVNHF